jgi:ABC-2 type transport system ATP-binding protein
VTPEVALRTENLTKSFGRTLALDHLTLEARAGEVFGFLGPNGAGKTTTIRLLLDLIRPTSGRAWVLGLDTHRSGAEVRRRVGHIPGEPALYGSLTGGEYLDFVGRLRGGVPRQSVKALAERLDLDLTRRIRELSRGNRQKVSLVAAFAADPMVLLLDEPTTGLDPLVQREFRALVREATGRGALVLLSSHDLDEVQRLADRAAVVNRGRLVAIEDVAGLVHKASRQVEIVFDRPVAKTVLAGVDGVSDVVADGRVAQCTLAGRPGSLLARLASLPVVSLTSREPDLEAVFLHVYEEGTRHAG